MTDWFYKATDASLDYESTVALVEQYGFICRSAKNSKGYWVSNVRKVALGDVIHLYYIDGGKRRAVGAFEVIRATEHPRPELFGDAVAPSALHRVNDAQFLNAVDARGVYKPDSVEKQFTGWLVRKIGDAKIPDDAFFSGRSTLNSQLTQPSGTSKDAAPPSRAPGEAWSEGPFFARAQSDAPERVQGLRKFYDLAARIPGVQLVWGRGSEYPRFIVRVAGCPGDLLSGWSEGWIGVQAQDICRGVGLVPSSLARLAALVGRPHWVGGSPESSSADEYQRPNRRRRFDASAIERDDLVADALSELLRELSSVQFARFADTVPGAAARAPGDVGQSYLEAEISGDAQRADPFERDPDKSRS